MRIRVLGIICLFVLSTNMAVYAVEKVVLRRDAIVYEAPFKDAKKIGKIRKGKKVKLIKRSGSWSHLQFSKAQGWVQNRYLKRERKEKTKSSSLLDLASGRMGDDNIVTTAGIRGLSEEKLKDARFNEQQVGKAESHRVSAQKARKYAAKGKLQSRTNIQEQ